MKPHWAALSTVLATIQPLAASFVPKTRNSVGPTQTVAASNPLLGTFPKITNGPIPDSRGLVGRADTLDRDTNSCGFYPDTYPFRCPPSMTCAYGSKFAGCCASGTTCILPTGCYSYKDVLNGSCAPSKSWGAASMACCDDKSSEFCVLHTVFLASTTLGLWGCAATSTGASLATTKPTSSTPSLEATSSTSTSPSTSTTTTSVSGSSTGNNTADSESSEKKSNTRAIVGGVVGGVCGLAVIGAAIFFFMRSRKKDSADSSPGTTAAAQPMLQNQQQNPPLGQDSPFGYLPQGGSPGYDPNAGFQPYSPPSEGLYDPHRVSQMSWGQPSPGLTISSGPQGSTPPGSTAAGTLGHTAPGPHQGQPVELPDPNVVGTPRNRAELG